MRHGDPAVQIHQPLSGGRIPALPLLFIIACYSMSASWSVVSLLWRLGPRAIRYGRDGRKPESPQYGPQPVGKSPP